MENDTSKTFTIPKTLDTKVWNVVELEQENRRLKENNERLKKDFKSMSDLAEQIRNDFTNQLIVNKDIQNENDRLEEEIKKSIKISCDGCKNNNLADCYGDSCLIHVAQFGTDSGIVVTNNYEEDKSLKGKMEE